MKKINRLLIANRGEIANRIINTCQKLNIETIAIFSDSDKNSLYVKNADESYYIGNSEINESYLNINKIIEIALENNIDAIHPGYGFLAENYNFAQKCQENNIILIAPSKDIINLSSSKSESKKLVKSLDIPVIEGYNGDEQNINTLIKEAKIIGFPLLIKSKFGGGGKGMKIVNSLDELENEITNAKLESFNSFGNDEIFLEKFYNNCRHIEFQIIGDNYGNILYLGDRECSIQRRYQKIIEESPALISDNLRKKMIESSLKIAKKLKYTNVGTIEYIVNNDNFYFLEINPRLQVEHTVTESITNLDLVELQIKIAENTELSLSQNDITFSGHSIQCRIYSENNDFTPSIGKILDYSFPKNIRLDNGIDINSEVSIYYDPMLAKVISLGIDREDCIKKLTRALKNSYIFGVENNINNLVNMLSNKDFLVGDYNTSFIKDNKKELNKFDNINYFLIAGLLNNWFRRKNQRKLLKNIDSGWRNNFFQKQVEYFEYQEKILKLEYNYSSNNIFIMMLEGDNNTYNIELIECNNNKISFLANNKLLCFSISTNNDYIYLHNKNFGSVCLKTYTRFPQRKKENNKNEYLSPLPGEIKKIYVKEGDYIKEGQILIVMYSMKMETSIYANRTGTIEAIFCNENSFIESNKLLLKIKD